MELHLIANFIFQIDFLARELFLKLFDLLIGERIVERDRNLVGFVYSFSRLSTVFSSFMIAFFLQRFGTVGVFASLASAMFVVVLSVGILGTRTRGRALEDIAQ